MKKYKNAIISVTVVLIILTLVFIFEGREQAPKNINTAEPTAFEITDTEDIACASPIPSEEVQESSKPNENAAQYEAALPKGTEEVKESGEPSGSTAFQGMYAPESEKEKKPAAAIGTNETQKPSESGASVTEKQTQQPLKNNDKKNICVLSVSCADALSSPLLAVEKAEVLPPDGVILSSREISFNDDESVFDVLKRELKRNKIPMEFSKTPAYNTAYIEGIANLYEFDCGNLSGWMYKVNGVFPEVGCSLYKINPGDVIEWVYTCNYLKQGGNKK